MEEIKEVALPNEEIERLWDAQRKYHGGEPCKVGHVEFAHAVIRATLAELQKDATPIGYANSDELDSMLDDRTATVAGVRDGWRNTPLYTHPKAATVPDDRLRRFASRILLHWVASEKDHACSRCFPDGDMVVPGFVCVYHEAVDVIAAPSLPACVSDSCKSETQTDLYITDETQDPSLPAKSEGEQK